VPHGHVLSDHPAHRGADHVHAVQAECLQQADRVVGQIGEPVGDRGRVAAEYGHDVGGPRGVQVRGEPDVAVVEPDDEVAAFGGSGAEVVRPPDHLRGQAHDDEHRRVAGVPEGLVGEVDEAGR
jgi:hypothetical protein